MALRRRALLHPNGDHFTLINIFNAFQQRECGQGLVGLHPCGHPTDPFVTPVSSAPPGVPHPLMCPCPGATFLTPSQCPAWLGEDLGGPSSNLGAVPSAQSLSPLCEGLTDRGSSSASVVFKPPANWALLTSPHPHGTTVLSPHHGPHCAIPVPMSLTPLSHLCPHVPDPAVPPADAGDEGWCRKHGLCSEALRLAGTVRTELLEVMRRIELPVSPPAFGSDANALNIQRALISGYFLKVGLEGAAGSYGGAVGVCQPRHPLLVPRRSPETSTAPAIT